MGGESVRVVWCGVQWTGVTWSTTFEVRGGSRQGGAAWCGVVITRGQCLPALPPLPQPTLPVRESASGEAEIVGDISRDMVVKVLEERGDWARVRWGRDGRAWGGGRGGLRAAAATDGCRGPSPAP